MPDNVSANTGQFTTYRIFLASSKSLREERERMEKEINRLNIDFGQSHHIRIELLLWENLDSRVYFPNKQQQCNDLLSTCDILVLLFWEELGKFSNEEYRVALELLKTTGKPEILIYEKNAQFDSAVSIADENVQNLARLRSELNKSGQKQWAGTFESPDKLILKFNEDLRTIFTLKGSPVQRQNNLRRIGLFGRDADVEQISGLLHDSNFGIITLIGPGGTGKSTLALKAAYQNEADFEERSVFVELAPLRDGKLIVDAIAKALSHDLNVNSLTRSPEQQLTEFLEHKRFIIILDNCEYLVKECAALAFEIAQKCRGIKIIATSQIALGVGTYEAVIEVKPLAEPSFSASYEETRSNPCVELFVLHARKVEPRFKYSPNTRNNIIRICKLRAGIPLGIILAASALKILSLDSVRIGIENSLQNKAERFNNAHDHHTTMQKAIDWSYNMLKDEEKNLFIELSLFRDDFNLEAAEHVTSFADTVQESLFNLIDASILTKSSSGLLMSKTFFLLEPLRKYGLEKFRKAATYQQTIQRFIEYYTGLTDHFFSLFFSGEQSNQLMRIFEQYNNIIEAIDLVKRTENWLPAARICSNLWRYWEVKAHFKEGISRIESVLEAAANEKEIYLELMHGLGMLYYRGGNITKAIDLFNIHLEAARKLGNTRAGKLNVAHALNNIANINSSRNVPESKRLLAEAYNIVKEFGDKRMIAVLENNQGTLYKNSRDLHVAMIYYSNSAKSFVNQQNLWESGYPLFGLGTVHFELGDFPEATRSFELAYQRRETAGDKRNMGRCELYLSIIELRNNDRDKSFIRLKASYSLLYEISDLVSWCEWLLAAMHYCHAIGFFKMVTQISLYVKHKYAEQLLRTEYLKALAFDLMNDEPIPSDWRAEALQLDENTVLDNIKKFQESTIVMS